VRGLLAVLVAVNPAAVGTAMRGRRGLAAGVVTTVVIATVLAGSSDWLLDLLDVSPPTFRLAAAVVLGVTAVRVLVAGPSSSDVPLLVALVTPTLAVTSVSVGADDGVAVVVAGALTAGVLALVAARVGPSLGWSIAARFVAAAGVVVAVALAVDAVKTV
jgi:hypothetical protein